MTGDSREYSVATIRELLLAAFSAETLPRFLRDRRDFRPVLDQFSRSHGLDDMVEELIEYCQINLLWDELLAEVQNESPRQYTRFQDRLYEERVGDATKPAPPVVTEPAAVPKPALGTDASLTPGPATTRWPWEAPRPAWFWPAVGGLGVVLVVFLVLVLWPRPPDDGSVTPTAPSTEAPVTDAPEPTEELFTVAEMRGESCGSWLDSDLEKVDLRLDGEPSWEANSEISYNRIIRTDPPAGTKVEPGSAVQVVCSLGPMRPVPNVVGMAQWYAEEELENCYPEPCFETRPVHERTGDMDEGHVLWTDPPAGAVVEPGSVVTICLAVPFSEARVPSLKNMTVEEASARLAASDLELGEVITETSPAVELGRVIRSDPPGGEMVDTSVGVTLVVSDGPEPVVVPNLVGQTWETAREELEGVGLHALKGDEQYHDDLSEGSVITAEPGAGEPVAPGSEIKLVLSLGLDPEGDRDNDGMPNGRETEHGLDPTNPDTDGDGIKDGRDPEPDYPLGGGEGQIAFSWVRDGNEDIYLMKVAGGAPVRLTDDPAQDFAPAWSPDGKRIAFVSDREGNQDIFVMDADGENLERLTGDYSEYDTNPAWSPDRNSIAFDAWRDGRGEIYVIDVDGTDLKNLTNNALWHDIMPAWSPAGDWIAFSSNRDGNWEIYQMDKNGNRQTRLTNNAAFDHEPAWAPDGRFIVFSSVLEDEGGLYLIDLDASDLDPYWLTEALTHSFPAWSPDGEWIAYAFDGDGEGTDLYLVHKDGTEAPLQPTSGEGDYRYPAWQPAVSP